MAEATRVATEEVDKAIAELKKGGADSERLSEIAAMVLKDKTAVGNLEEMVKVADNALRQAERCTRLGMGTAILYLQTSDAYGEQAKEVGRTLIPPALRIAWITEKSARDGWAAIIETISRQKLSAFLDVLVDECRCRPKGQE